MLESKRVLIVGENSYIGNSFCDWVNNNDRYQITKISVRDNNWLEKDLSEFDSIIYLSAIVHQKESLHTKREYYTINAKLPLKFAIKAKKDGVKQFIFMSSMNVYGLEEGIIDFDTKPKPKSLYGKSKLIAERNLKQLESYDFALAIVRPPIVYGQDCVGNFARLIKLINCSLVFPDINNKRSMIYIDHLSEFLRLLIEHSSSGYFYPQNTKYVNTKKVFLEVKKIKNKKIRLTKLSNPILKPLIKNIKTLKKIFGDLVYNKEMSDHFQNKYNNYNFKETIDFVLYK